MGKEIQFKRVNINGKLTALKVDVVVADVVYVERDEEKKLVNFYFPKDDVNNIYELGVAMPIDLLDGYVQAKVSQGIKKVNAEILKDVELPDVEIG